MPQVNETEVMGFASCYNPRCPGYEQEEVPVLRREAFYMREENGGDIPGVDHSTIIAVDQSVTECPHCGGPRIAALERRPEYAPISGQHPLALLDLNDHKIQRDHEITALQQQADTATLRAELAELRSQMSASTATTPPQEVRRGPGRPRKEPEE